MLCFSFDESLRRALPDNRCFAFGSDRKVTVIKLLDVAAFLTVLTPSLLKYCLGNLRRKFIIFKMNNDKKYIYIYRYHLLVVDKRSVGAPVSSI